MRDLSDILAEAVAEAEARERTEAEERGLTVRQAREADRLEASIRRRQAEERHAVRAREAWIDRHRRFAPLAAVEAVYDRALRDRPATKHVRAFMNSQRPALVLMGGTGVGKTVAALAAVREQPQGVFVKAAELARAVDPWWRERAEGWRQVDIEAPLFVVDDLGAETDEPRFHQALFAVVDTRDAADRKTIIASNLKPAQIRERYGDRIADRLNAMARAVRIGGESLREQGAGL